jgi:ABC-type branched-subunit amino acid transport system ATPase component
MVKDKLEIESTVEIEEQGDALLPAYFLALRLKNVRSFGPVQTLDLSNGAGRPAQWTIILGDNGVGKTTLLHSLVAITPVMGWTKGQVMPRCADILRFKWPLYRSGKSEYELSGDFLVDTTLSKSGGREIVNFAVGRDRQSCGYKPFNHREMTEFTCFGYGASRRMGETTLSEKGEDDPFASLFSDSVELLNAEEWLLQADYAARAGSNAATRKRAEKRRDEIKEILINLLPDVDDIKFAQITEKQSKPGVEVKTPYGWVSIKDLSLGYKTLIAWMVDLASRMFTRYPDSPNPLAEPAVVLVDEIDLHLHPKWQRTLMSYLSERFPNTQFIATAHSPLVVQAASDANVVLLRREGDHVVIDNDVKDIHGWRVDQILTSDLFGLESARPPQLDPLLAERTKILSKSRLTKKDKARLEEIEAEIGALPTGETPEDMEAMDVIRRAAEHLKAQGF